MSSLRDSRHYEFEATATFGKRLDEGAIQDILEVLAQVLKNQGGSEARVEAREVHFAEGQGWIG